MVAQKKGRGAKAQAAKAKAAAAAAVEEQQIADSEIEQFDGDDNNGDAEQEQLDDSTAQEEGGEQAEGQENADGEAKADEKKEEKVESGKLLVENLPTCYLFDYQEKLNELFSRYGEVTGVKRGPIVVTELTTTPTLSAIVEFKNKESLDKALSEDGTVLNGSAISVIIESRSETAVMVSVPYEVSIEYLKALFSQCGEVAHIHEFSKTKYKILRVTFHAAAAVDKALKLNRELRINGFRVTVCRYREEDEQKDFAATLNQNKRPHPQNQNRNANNSTNSPNATRTNFRGRGGAFNARGNFRGARGRGAFGRGGAFPRGGFAPVNTYMPPQAFMGRPGGFMNDGQRPNKRPRQM